jgi:hypothetical protein
MVPRGRLGSTEYSLPAQLRPDPEGLLWNGTNMEGDQLGHFVLLEKIGEGRMGPCL